MRAVWSTYGLTITFTWYLRSPRREGISGYPILVFTSSGFPWNHVRSWKEERPLSPLQSWSSDLWESKWDEGDLTAHRWILQKPIVYYRRKFYYWIDKFLFYKIFSSTDFLSKCAHFDKKCNSPHFLLHFISLHFTDNSFLFLNSS